MDAQVLARWQFGITTVYHFFFVPVTIGLSFLVAIMQTVWVRTNNAEWLRLTKFFMKLFLINFAAGLVTGIVQEFQFGMNWSEYSRFVGDIFGAPLALEALIAFFLESTFIGLWIFGWGRLSKGLHLATIWLVAAGTVISALWILAANSWMQNPVGAVYRNGRAELTDFMALPTNPFFLGTASHVIAASFMTGGGLLCGVAGWWLIKSHHRPTSEAFEAADSKDVKTWRRATRLGAWVLIAASLATFGSGHWQGQIEAKYQPMKLAASEGLYETTSGAPFSIVAVFTSDGTKKVWSLDVPYVLSILAHNDPNATVYGIQDLRDVYLEKGYINPDGSVNELQKSFAQQLRALPVEPVPNVWVSFYSFRVMMGLGVLAFLIGLLVLVSTRGERVPRDTRLWRVALVGLPFLPLLGNSAGWILAEMGRQPWIVYGVLPTWTAASPGNSAGVVLATMVLYTLLYGVIAVVVLFLFNKTVKEGLPEVVTVEPSDDDSDAPVSFAY
ncbi:cytochrome d ubiquinol oxidase subunit I [Propionibacterium cyclohexanicum]|uniref:Cytochrome d ubiquinol oxidase subunit I n=1 Tax=Propionibacterium cyclohexanicum TaxID=64702 RepID=A0A1H9T2I0_9ACTN|nr:cytochrome ubiquinol oxidase subunit I [Propionibacterium cyclohexanicum]SER91460.1 cytochrome d ubiquinol oxidase subunit I [Propionibacterium cyclohexanicum]